MRFVATFFILLLACFGSAQTKDHLMPHHATGSFTVEVKPLTPTPAEGIGRYSINKHLSGSLMGDTQGEMFSGGDPKSGQAGYVAIERVTGTLDGRRGTFVLQHFATIDANGPQMTVRIVPGSGTEELQGITGTFAITVASGQHTYDLIYTLPE